MTARPLTGSPSSIHLSPRPGAPGGWRRAAVSIVVGGAAVALAVGASPLLAGAVILASVVIGRHRARAAETARRRRREAALPFTIDLVAVVLGAGGTVAEAVTAVAADGPPAVRAHFAAVRRRSRSGLVMSDALAPLSDELGPAFHPLVGALIASEHGGASLGSLLQRLADDVDQARRREAEARAKRLPVALLAPLVLCLLPAVVVGAVAPLVIVALRHLAL